MKDLLQPYKSIAILGLAKNTGKTTVLNHILRMFCDETLAITSIGRDGEMIDLVTGTPKPRVFVQAGTFFASAEGLLQNCKITKEIVKVTDFSTPLGRVVIVQARSSGFVEIAGPSIIERVCELEMPGERFIIDGAVGRLSHLAAAEAVVLCTGAAIDARMEAVVRRTQQVVKILCLKTPAEGEDFVFIDGALTDANFSGIVAVERPSKIFTTQKLDNVRVLKPVKLAAIAVNPYSPYGWAFDVEEFIDRMGSEIPIYDLGRC